MSNRSIIGAAVAAIAGAIVLPASVGHAALAVTLANELKAQSFSSAYTDGFAFNVASTGATVGAVDFADLSFTPEQTSTTVRIYSQNSVTSAITTLLTQTVSTSDPIAATTGGGTPPGGNSPSGGVISYHEHTLTAPLVLPYSPTLTYYIAGLVPFDDSDDSFGSGLLYNANYNGNGLATDPSITYLGDVSNREADATNPTPTTSYFGTGFKGGFAANFQTVVPEPTSLAIVAAGIGLLGARRRRRLS